MDYSGLLSFDPLFPDNYWLRKNQSPWVQPAGPPPVVAAPPPVMQGTMAIQELFNNPMAFELANMPQSVRPTQQKEAPTHNVGADPATVEKARQQNMLRQAASNVMEEPDDAPEEEQSKSGVDYGNIPTGNKREAASVSRKSGPVDSQTAIQQIQQMLASDPNPYRDEGRYKRYMMGAGIARQDLVGAARQWQSMADAYDQRQVMQALPVLLKAYEGKNLGDSAVLRQLMADLVATGHPLLVQQGLNGLIESGKTEEKARYMAGVNETGDIQKMRAIANARWIAEHPEKYSKERVRRAQIELETWAGLFTAKDVPSTSVIARQIQELQKKKAEIISDPYGVMSPEAKQEAVSAIDQQIGALQQQFSSSSRMGQVPGSAQDGDRKQMIDVLRSEVQRVRMTPEQARAYINHPDNVKAFRERNLQPPTLEEILQ